MLIDDFAKQHYLCEEGENMIRPFMGRTVEDCWRNAGGPALGTYVFWVASRAQVEPRVVVRCAVQCVSEALDVFGTSIPEISQAMDAVRAWCDGIGSHEAAREAGEAAMQVGNQLTGRDSNPQYFLCSAVKDLTRCTKTTIHTPAVVGTLAEAYIRGGKKSFEEAHARFGAIVRQAIAWADVDQAIQAGRPSPKPRPKSADEVAETAQNVCAAWNDLLRNTQQAVETLDTVCRDEKISLDNIHQFIEQDGFGSTGRQLVSQTVQGLENTDRDSAASPSKGRMPRTKRMMV